MFKIAEEEFISEDLKKDKRIQALNALFATVRDKFVYIRARKGDLYYSGSKKGWKISTMNYSIPKLVYREDINRKFAKKFLQIIENPLRTPATTENALTELLADFSMEIKSRK